MTAANILQNALGHMQDRAATYDKPDGERSMGATVDAFKAVTGVLMTEEQGWLFMSLLKAVRSQQGAYRADSYEDGAAYFALAGESAAKERNGGWDAEAIKAAALPASFGQQNMIDPADVEIYLEAWRASDAAYSKPETSAALKPIHPSAAVEVASEIDDESPRAQVVQQNGEMAAEVYAAVDAVDPWAGAPEWAKYKAQDKSGAWYWFDSMPKKGVYEWRVGSARSAALYASRNDQPEDWRRTLISR